MSVQVWPDTTDALFELLEGTEHAGEVIRVVEELPPTQPNQPPPGFDEILVQVHLEDTAIGQIDRVDKYRMAIYGYDRQVTKNVAESITSLVCVDGGWETPAALIDDAVHQSGPAPTPHPDSSVRRFDLRFWLTVRPV